MSRLKYLFREKYPIVPALVFINGLTVAFRVAVVSQGISHPNAWNCIGLLPPLDSQHL